MKTQVFAFAPIDDKETRLAISDDLLKGKSRFEMLDQTTSLRDEPQGNNIFLLRANVGDWIVHIDIPASAQCAALKVAGEYGFVEGIKCPWGNDFNNFIPVDPDTVVVFNRNNPNILPSVNLSPRRRAQRVLQVEDFLESIENLKERKYDAAKKPDKSITHLQNKVSKLLPQITAHIQEMNKSKAFERFLHRVFSNMANTLSIQNGFGWRTDNGADLIVEFDNPIIGVNVTTKLIVQAKSYSGEHFDTNAIDQIVEGIGKYNADAGLLITTANETEVLEEYLRKKSEEIGKTIDMIAGNDVAKFVLRYAPELLIGN